MELLLEVLEEDPELIESVDSYQGMRPLHWACVLGRLEATRVLLDRGADYTVLDATGDSPLMTACAFGRAALVSLLLARGADPTERDRERKTGLIRAVQGSMLLHSEYVEVLRLLLSDGRVRVDARDNRGRTALWWACHEKLGMRVQVLMVEGMADHTLADQAGVTPMDAYGTSRSDCEQLCEVGNGQHEYVSLQYVLRSRPCLINPPASSLVCMLAAAQLARRVIQKPFLLSKARAMVDDTVSITKAPKKAKAKTEAEVQRARVAAAPTYLRDRVMEGGALPAVEVDGIGGKKRKVADEMQACLEYVVRSMNKDLFAELIEGLRHPREREVMGKEDGGTDARKARGRTGR